MTRTSDEPRFDLDLLASCSLWFGLAWLAADWIAAPDRRSLDARPILGLLVVLGSLPALWIGSRLDAADLGRCWLTILLLRVLAAALPAVCLAQDGRLGTRLYPDPTRERLWAWVCAGLGVGILAIARIWRISRRLSD